MYRWILLKQDTHSLRRQLQPAIIFIVSYSLINTIFWRLAVAPMDGNADLWCWIPKDMPWSRFGSVYVYVYPSMLWVSWVFIQVS